MKSRLSKALLILLVVLSGIVILPTGLESILVRYKLNQTIATIEQALKASDTHATLLYDDVSVTGLLLGKRVKISAPRVEWQQDDKKFLLKFSSITAGLSGTSLLQWKIDIAGPLTLIHNMRNEAEMSLDSSAIVDVNLYALGSRELDAQLTLPKQLVITPTVKPSSKAAIVFEENPLIAIKSDKTGQLVYARLESKKAIAQGPVPENRYVLDEASAIYQVSIDPVTGKKTDLDLVIKNLEVPEYIHPYGPAYLIARGTLNGDIAFSAAGLLQLMATKANLEVRELSLNFKDFGLNLKGNSKTITAEWPAADYTIVIRNAMLVVNEITRQFNLPSDKRALMYSLISKMTGQSVSDIQDMNISIKRAAGEELMISGIPLSEFVKAIQQTDISKIKSKE